MELANISKDEVREVLRKVPSVIRDLVAEKEKLASAVATYQKREKAEEIVSLMEARGLSDSQIPFRTRVDQILSSEKDLDVVKEAVALAGPSISFGSPSEKPGVSDGSFVDFLMSGEV